MIQVFMLFAVLFLFLHSLSLLTNPLVAAILGSVFVGWIALDYLKRIKDWK